MKNILYLVLFLFTTIYPQSWEWQNPLPQGKTLKNVFTVDDNTAYAVGENGAIIQTVDGGANWLNITSGVITSLNTCFFVNANTGYTAGDNGVILKVSNGSIISLSSNSSSDLHTLYFFNEQTGYAAGSNGTLLFTLDGGNSWIEKSTIDQKTISDLFFISGNTGWYTGQEGVIRFTNDGGNNWADQNSQTNNILSSIFFINNLTGWVCGTGGVILKTSDGGSSWFSLNSNTTSWLKTIRFFDENNGIAVGTPGIILTTTDGGNNWTENNSPSSFDLSSLSISGNGTGWLVGENGLVIKTTDMGSMWEFQTKGFQTEINDILFFNVNEGIAVGNDGLIITTTNGGIEWIKRESGTSKNINALDYYSGRPDEIWAAGDSATLLFSSDRGITWNLESLTHITTDNFYSIEVASNYAAVCGEGGVFFNNLFQFNTGWVLRRHPSLETLLDIHSFNQTFYLVAGTNSTISFLGKGALTGWIWGANFTLNVSDLNDLQVIGINRGWAVGKYGFIVYSDAYYLGRWNIINQLDVNALHSVHFLNSIIGYTVGTNGSAFKTMDGGYNWQPIHTGITNFLKRVVFVNENTGWIVGNNGALLKTTNGGGISTDIKNELSSIPDNYYLFQNYPNPFNPVTNIKFRIPESGFVSLKVYDILGNEISTLVNAEKSAGEYSVQFDGSELSSGTYFYRLTTENFTETRKLLLLK